MQLDRHDQLATIRQVASQEGGGRAVGGWPELGGAVFTGSHRCRWGSLSFCDRGGSRNVRRGGRGRGGVEDARRCCDSEGGQDGSLWLVEVGGLAERPGGAGEHPDV